MKNESLQIPLSESERSYSSYQSFMKEETCSMKMHKIALKYNESLQEAIREGNSTKIGVLLYDNGLNMQDLRKNLQNGSFDTKAERYLLSVDLALLSLSEKERTILYNEYFFPAPRNWWKEKAKRSSFYRIKKEAVARFLTIMDL